MNLGVFKQKQTAAKKGYDLLKSKADALKVRFRDICKVIYDTKVGMADQSSNAFFSLTQAEYAAGNFRSKILEANMVASVRVTSRTDNVAGVKLPVFNQYDTGAKFEETLGLVGGGRKIQASKERFGEYLSALVKIASLQTSFLAMDEALKITNRRVNALENVTIPKIVKTIDYINRKAYSRATQFAEGYFNPDKNKKSLGESVEDAAKSLEEQQQHEQKAIDDRDLVEVYIACLNNLAACKISLKDYSAAKDLCVQVLQLSPWNGKALLRAAKATLAMDAYDECEACLKKLISIENIEDSLKTAAKVEYQKLKKAISDYKNHTKEMQKRIKASKGSSVSSKFIVQPSVSCKFLSIEEETVSLHRPHSSQKQLGKFDNLSKKEILAKLQASCSMDFLRHHHLNASTEAILKKRNIQQLQDCWKAWDDSVANGHESDGLDTVSNEGDEIKEQNRLVTAYGAVFRDAIEEWRIRHVGHKGEPTVTVLLLHEDYQYELPVFRATHGSTSPEDSTSSEIVLCVMGAVRDMTVMESTALAQALSLPAKL
eukprot:gene460-303_t